MVVAALIGLVGLCLFARHVLIRGGEGNPPVGTVVGGIEPSEPFDADVRYQVIAIYPTESLSKLAKTIDFGAFQSQEEMAKAVREAALAEHLLVSIYLAESQRGRVSERAFINYPGRYNYRFPMERMLMQWLAGKTPPDFRDKPKIVSLDKPKIVAFPDQLLQDVKGLKPDEIWDRVKTELEKMEGEEH